MQGAVTINIVTNMSYQQHIIADFLILSIICLLLEFIVKKSIVNIIHYSLQRRISKANHAVKFINIKRD